MRGGTIGCVVAKFDGAAVLSDRTPCRKYRPNHWQLMICQAVTAIFFSNAVTSRSVNGRAGLPLQKGPGVCTDTPANYQSNRGTRDQSKRLEGVAGCRVRSGS